MLLSAREKRRQTEKCVACGKTALDVQLNRLFKCSVCTIAPRYCSVECQTAGWPSHKAECKANRLTWDVYMCVYINITCMYIFYMCVYVSHVCMLAASQGWVQVHVKGSELTRVRWLKEILRMIGPIPHKARAHTVWGYIFVSYLTYPVMAFRCSNKKPL